MLSNREHIADVVQEETGKVRGDSGLESIYLEMAINFWGENGEKYLADEIAHPGPPAGQGEAASGCATGPTRSSGSSAPGTSR